VSHDSATGKLAYPSRVYPLLEKGSPTKGSETMRDVNMGITIAQKRGSAAIVAIIEFEAGFLEVAQKGPSRLC
jgi:hypothetical protein